MALSGHADTAHVSRTVVRNKIFSGDYMSAFICDSCIHMRVCSESFDGPVTADCAQYINVKNFTAHNMASDAMRRFDDVNIEALSDHDMAWTARIIVREYRAALAHIA